MYPWWSGKSIWEALAILGIVYWIKDFCIHGSMWFNWWDSFLTPFFKCPVSLSASIWVSQVVSAICSFTAVLFKLDSNLGCLWSVNVTIYWTKSLIFAISLLYFKGNIKAGCYPLLLHGFHMHIFGKTKDWAWWKTKNSDAQVMDMNSKIQGGKEVRWQESSEMSLLIF